MREIIEYRTILQDGSNSQYYTARINEAIKEGWQPYGSVVSHQGMLIQPMVRYAPVPTLNHIA